MFIDETTFKKRYTIEQRVKQVKKVRHSHPDKYPIIVTVINSSLSLDNNKFLVSGAMTIGSFLEQIRERSSNKSTIGLFLCIKNILIKPTSTIKELYNEYKDPDEYLYMTVKAENTFG